MKNKNRTFHHQHGCSFVSLFFEKETRIRTSLGPNILTSLLLPDRFIKRAPATCILSPALDHSVPRQGDAKTSDPETAVSNHILSFPEK